MKLGRFYGRPHVRSGWAVGNKPRWWPVLGPQHEDGEIIGFPFEHFHVDARFMDGRTRRGLDAAVARTGAPHRVYSTPISAVSPEGTDWKRQVQCWPASDSISLSDLAAAPEAIDRSLWFRVLRVKFKAHPPSYPVSRIPWLVQLERAHVGERLGPTRKCPHRGADLTGIEPDALGVIRCPLHGLGWCGRTGRLVPCEQWTQGELR